MCGAPIYCVKGFTLPLQKQVISNLHVNYLQIIEASSLKATSVKKYFTKFRNKALKYKTLLHKKVHHPF